MPIGKSDVEKIAELARLDLTDEETASFTTQLSAIISYIDKLNELDIDDVPATSHSSTADDDVEYSMRDDEARPGLGQKVALENAPDAADGYFRVPKVIGG